ncbi:carboxypeptidase-like regulatory domain-containing protein [Dyadobacter soli]
MATFSALLIALALYDQRSALTANGPLLRVSPLAGNIEGTVRNEDGALLSNVNVVIKGTQRSTATSGSGRFSISVNAGEEATLVFSLTGYQSQEIHLGTKTTLDVMLKAESDNSM